MRVLVLDICEYGVPERTEPGYGEVTVRVEVAFALWTEIGGREAGVAVDVVVVVDLEGKSVREDEAAVDVEPRVSLACVA